MMGRQTVDQGQLFYLFNLEERIPADHLLRRINPVMTRVLTELREMNPFIAILADPATRSASLCHRGFCLPPTR
jgi:hypothetical protein